MAELTPYQKGYWPGFRGWSRANPYSRAADWQRWLKWKQGNAKGKMHRREEQAIRAATEEGADQ